MSQAKKKVAKKMSGSKKKDPWAYAKAFNKGQSDIKKKNVREYGYHTLPESSSYKEPKKPTSSQLKKWGSNAEKNGTKYQFERVFKNYLK